MKDVRKYVGILFFLVLSIPGLKGQVVDSSKIGIGYVIGNDTIIHRDIREVWVYPRREFRNPRLERQYYRLIQRVKKVYPYARKASELLAQYEPEFEPTGKSGN
jgi:hypothetical protein